MSRGIRIGLTLLGLTIALAFAGCGGTTPQEAPTPRPTATLAPPTATPEPTATPASEPSAALTPEPSAEPASDQEPSESAWQQVERLEFRYTMDGLSCWASVRVYGPTSLGPEVDRVRVVSADEDAFSVTSESWRAGPGYVDLLVGTFVRAVSVWGEYQLSSHADPDPGKGLSVRHLWYVSLEAGGVPVAESNTVVMDDTAWGGLREGCRERLDALVGSANLMLVDEAYEVKAHEIIAEASCAQKPRQKDISLMELYIDFLDNSAVPGQNLPPGDIRDIREVAARELSAFRAHDATHKRWGWWPGCFLPVP